MVHTFGEISEEYDDRIPLYYNIKNAIWNIYLVLRKTATSVYKELSSSY